MARTEIPAPGKVARGVTVKQVQKQAHNWLRFCHGDLDKAGDLNDYAYYQGLVDAYSDVLWFIEQQPVSQFHVGRSKKLFALLPAAIVVSTLIHETRKDPDVPA